MLKRMKGDVSDEDEMEDVRQDELNEMNEEQKMAALMGFGGFDSTKGQKVEDNHSTANRGAISKTKRREYKQVRIDASTYTP